VFTTRTVQRFRVSVSLAVLAATLGSCVRPYAVWVLPGATIATPTFGLARKRGGTKVDPLWAVAFYRCHGRSFAQLQDAVWFIEERGGENALTRLTYGVVPGEFRAPKPAPAPRARECYDVAATGPGRSGGTAFRVSADGRLAELSAAERRAMGDSAFAREVAHGEAAVRMCRTAYRAARSGRDTARVDSLALRDATGELPPLDCGFLRSPAGGQLR
jgi:hypothetical protein